MATRSSTLPWEIPRTEEPGRLQSIGWQELDTTQQVNHHRQYPYLENSMDKKSLAGYSLWDHKEQDMTEHTRMDRWIIKYYVGGGEYTKN